MSEESKIIADVLSRLSENKNLEPRDKRWITERINDMHQHERNMKILEYLATEPDAYWKMILLGGMGVTALGAAFSIVPTITPDTNMFPNGFVVAGLELIPAGLTLSVLAAIMLVPRQLFGEDGVQFEIEAAGSIPIIGGGSGTLKVG